MPAIIRAIDVGRRNTKFIIDIADSIPVATIMPSMAPAFDKRPDQTPDLSGRNTISIPIGNLAYEVGPEVHLAVDRYEAQMMQNDRYCDTPEYMALTLGAIDYMRVPHIDLLVVGVPVSMFKQSKAVAALERKLTGTHRLAGGRAAHVRSVRALAQPGGALMQFATMHENLNGLRQQRTLVIDAGSRTFDWLVASGMQQIASRSNSVDRGMFDVLDTIANAISANLGRAYRDIEAIDSALRSGDKPVIFQRPYEIGRHLAIAKKIPEQAVAEMLRHTGNGADINHIVLVGGGSFFFRSAVQSAFPNHRITELEQPVLATVLGFQTAGVNLSDAMATAAAAEVAS